MEDIKNNRSVFLGFMDNKFDDKVAFWYLYKYGGYDKYIVVFSAIKNMESACGDFYDFLYKMDSDLNYRKNIIVLEGYTREAPHESTFIGKSRHTDGDFKKDINNYFESGDKIYILQSAPTPKKYIMQLVRNENIVIDKYHGIHGYNTGQISLNNYDNNQVILEWLKSIREEIQTNHKDVSIRFTNNWTSFVKSEIKTEIKLEASQPYSEIITEIKSGATQPYSKIKTLFPYSHVEAALNDPFIVRQLTISYNILKNAKENGIILDNVFKDISLVPAGFDINKLSELVLIARKNEESFSKEYRYHFLNVVNKIVSALEIVETYYANLNSDDDKKMYKEIKNRKFRVAKGVKKSFIGEMTLELCDANHVIAVMICDGIFNKRLSKELVEKIKKKWKPMQFIFNEKNDIIFDNVHVEEDEDIRYKGDGLTIYDLETDDILQVMESLK